MKKYPKPWTTSWELHESASRTLTATGPASPGHKDREQWAQPRPWIHRRTQDRATRQTEDRCTEIPIPRWHGMIEGADIGTWTYNQGSLAPVEASSSLGPHPLDAIGSRVLLVSIFSAIATSPHNVIWQRQVVSLSRSRASVNPWVSLSTGLFCISLVLRFDSGSVA